MCCEGARIALERLREATKKFKKNLFLQPAMPHLILEDQPSGQNRQALLQKINVGAYTPSVWGKNFKIRITSISTGKKIDLNVKFDVNKG